MENYWTIKACVYKDAKGNFFPVAYMVESQIPHVIMDNGHPRTCGVRIVPMGRTPIKGIIERMSLTEFESLLGRFDCTYVCNIPLTMEMSASDVYAAFRLMILGMNKLTHETETETEIDSGNETESFSWEEIEEVLAHYERSSLANYAWQEKEKSLFYAIEKASWRAQKRQTLVCEIGDKWYHTSMGYKTGYNLISYYENEMKQTAEWDWAVLEKYNAKQVDIGKVNLTDIAKTNKLLAIRMYRDFHDGCHLAEAKAAVEAMMAENET